MDAAGLKELKDKSVDEIVAILRRLVDQVTGTDLDALQVVALREQAIDRIKKEVEAVNSPAQMVDAALKSLFGKDKQDNHQGQDLQPL